MTAPEHFREVETARHAEGLVAECDLAGLAARPPIDQVPIRFRWPSLTHLAAVACLVVSLGITAWAFFLLVRSTSTGYDITDEGFALYAADPANKANIANGLWGLYTGLVYRAVGYSLIGFRIAGIVLLSGCAAWLGSQAGRFLGCLTGRSLKPIGRAALVISTVAAAQLYYAWAMVLSPSYDWLALLGSMLALSGLLGALSAPDRLRSRFGHVALISVGCFLAVWARPVAGIVVWLVAQAVVLAITKGRRRRLWLVVVGLGTLAVLAALQSAFLLNPATAVAALNRARSLNFDHGWSVSIGVLLRNAISRSAGGLGAIPGRIFHAAGLWPLVGLAPALAWFVKPERRAAFAAVTSCAALLAVGAGLIITQQFFDGGYTRATSDYSSVRLLSGAVLALLTTAALSWAACTWLRLRSATTDLGLPRRAAMLAVVSAAGPVAIQVLAAFTTVNPLVDLMSASSVLGLLAVQVMLVAAVGRKRAPAAVLTVAVLVPVVLAVGMVSGRQDPYRDAPLAAATTNTSISFRGAQVRLAPMYAAYFNDLVGPAKKAGFVPGTPLIELTPFHPGAAVALGAAAPNTLVFGYTANTARWVLSQQDQRVWHDAWLLTATTAGSPSVSDAPWAMNEHAINLVTSIVGRSFPADYQLVAVATWPWGHQRQELWRPRQR